METYSSIQKDSKINSSHYSFQVAFILVFKQGADVVKCFQKTSFIPLQVRKEVPYAHISSFIGLSEYIILHSFIL
jgi:hypothetical protein